MANKNLSAAKAAKKDEFYTQYEDIERELQHYWQHFRGKTVLCNCDDPYESNFFKYFASLPPCSFPQKCLLLHLKGAVRLRYILIFILHSLLFSV